MRSVFSAIRPRQRRGQTLRAPILQGLIALTLACGSPDEPTFVGTWERPLPGGHSLLSISKSDRGYIVRWSKIDGNQTVRCDPTGHCEEFLGEQKVYEWIFRARTGAGSEELYVEVQGIPVDNTTPALTYTDRLVLAEGGRELWSYQISENGKPMDPPGGPVKFFRVSHRPL